MSAFLGKIHFWMYNKIKLVVEREEFIYAEAAKICSDYAEEGKEIVQQTYGLPLPNKDLSDLIDHRDIHGWLQRQLNRTQCREAALVIWFKQNSLFQREWFHQVYARQAQEVALQMEKSGTCCDTAESLYETLQDVQLNGMPCDDDNKILKSSAEEVVWQIMKWHVKENWQRAEADIVFMKELYKTWNKAFLEALNSAYHVVEQDDAFHIQRKF